MLSSVT